MQHLPSLFLFSSSNDNIQSSSDAETMVGKINNRRGGGGTFGEGSIVAETIEKPFSIVNEWFLGVS